jgi:hypothetical protein
MRRAGALGVGLLALVACGPIPVAQAERECLEQARLAERPRGHVGIMAGNFGVQTSLGLEVSTDYLAGRDPEEVYTQCVMRRSGEAPRRPYRLS